MTDGAPNDGMPNDGAPNDGMPNDGMPNDGMPTDDGPTDDGPTDGVPAAEPGGGPAPAAPPEGCPAHDGAPRMYGPRLAQDPAGAYRRMRREHGSVAPVLLDGDLPAWLVLGYREFFHVTSDPELFGRDPRRWTLWDRVPRDWPLAPFVRWAPSGNYTEGREHRRRSAVYHEALAAVDQFETRAHCEEVADRLIDLFSGAGEADLMADYAHPMPLLATARMLGLPDTEAPDALRDMLQALGGPDAPAAYGRLAAAMRRLVEARRERPGPDVASRMIAHPAELTDEQLVADLVLMMTAAQQSCAYWIGNTLRLMLTDGRFAVTLSGGRRSVGQALNEVLWADAPTQAVAGRWATRDTRLGGHRIRAGDMLVLGLGAANSDPQVWPDQQAGPVGNHAHTAFGHGEHGCPYPAQELGELMARTAVEVLLDRLPDVLLAVPAEDLRWVDSLWARGLTALPVHFTPTAPADPEDGD